MNKLKSEEQELPKKSSVGKRLAVFLSLFIALIILGACGYVGYLAYLSPVEKLQILNETYNPKPHPEGSIDYRIDNELFRIKKEEAFTSSKVKMLSSDSIYLSVNLKDSEISIEIQGVSMLRVKISKITKSGIFDAMDGTALINQFSTPFKIDSTNATILKDPFILKIAPHDTIEAQADVSIPDTVRSEPVFFTAYLDKGILLQVGQSEDDEERSAFKYRIKKRLEKTLQFLKTAMTFKVPEYQPYISIEIPAKDARAIFRAIPAKSLIAIRLE